MMAACGGLGIKCSDWWDEWAAEKEDKKLAKKVKTKIAPPHQMPKAMIFEEDREGGVDVQKTEVQKNEVRNDDEQKNADYDAAAGGAM